MKLKDYLLHTPMRIVHCAKKLGISKTHLHSILKGGKPSDYLKRKIEIMTDGQVSFKDWPEKK